MKKLNNFDFLAINKIMNGNWNGGENQFTGPTKKISKGEENKLYLLLLNSRDSKEYEFGRKVPVVCYWNKEWCRFERLEHTTGERNVNQNDINAWKEIVLPELKEGE